VSAEVVGRRVVVAGIAVSGAATAQALLDAGAQVLVVDAHDGATQRAAAKELEARGAQVRLGDADTPVADADLVVTSPGWRPSQPLLAAALAAGVEVIGEPALAQRLQPAPGPAWLGVTGTNGKTTTVGMLEAILQASGRHAVAAGNVGLPLVSAVRARPPYDVLAVELSSFQLHWSAGLRLHAATVLNVAEDHLDWHGSMAAYAEDKARIWARAEHALYNADDAWSARLGRGHPSAHGFSIEGPADFAVADGALVGPGGERLAALEAVGLPGRHNLANALAAAGLAWLYGVRGDAIEAGLRGYSPGPHRNETVAAVDGITWVDDSKATNPHAAAASLGAYPRVVWIAGGLFKGADVGPLVEAQAGRLAGVVVIGSDRRPLLDALARHAADVPVVEVVARDTGPVGAAVLADAVRAARELARAGDTVLLAPAAASMDQFRDYAERGALFAAAVHELTGPKR
jgi:UDP-N-acetylmuramoylalanine--D-glutamate ligase